MNVAYCNDDLCLNQALPNEILCASCLYGKLLVVLDLDETLLHSNNKFNFQAKPLFCYHDVYHVFPRPHLDVFLEYVFNHYDVCFWTAGSCDYANTVLKNILKPNQVPYKVLSRNDTIVRNKYDFGNEIETIKPLNKLRVNLARVVIVDDKFSNFMYNTRNAIHISEFIDPDQQSNDNSLLEVLEILKSLELKQDVRSINLNSSNEGK